MLDRLPNLIDPLLLADRNAAIEGKMPIADLERLRELLVDESGEISLKLFFARAGKLATVEGHISTVLALKCQRCLETLEWPISSDIKLGIVTSLEQANNLPDGYEPLLHLDEDKIPLKNIIEDELLLSVPSVPKHQDNCLAPNIPANKSELILDTTHSATKKPFSILADLKKLETYNGSTKK